MLYNENGHPVESAKQIHSISQPEQEKIEAFKKSLEAAKDDSVIEESEEDKK